MGRYQFLNEGTLLREGSILYRWTILHGVTFAWRHLCKASLLQCDNIKDVTNAWQNFCTTSSSHGVTFSRKFLYTAAVPPPRHFYTK